MKINQKGTKDLARQWTQRECEESIKMMAIESEQRATKMVEAASECKNIGVVVREGEISDKEESCVNSKGENSGRNRMVMEKPEFSGNIQRHMCDLMEWQEVTKVNHKIGSPATSHKTLKRIERCGNVPTVP